MLRQVQARTLQSLASNTYRSATVGTLSKGVLRPLSQPTITTLRSANARHFATETWEGQPPNIPGTGEPTSRLPGDGRSSAPGFGTGTTSSPSSSSAFGAAGEPASQDYEELVVLEEAPTTSLFAPFWTLMLVTGMAGLAIGLGTLSPNVPVWPQEIRTDLSIAFRETMKGSRESSAYHLYRAWEKAKEMPLERFGSNPFLKLSGIGIALASTYDHTNKHLQAYEVYHETLSQFLDPSTPGDSATAKLRQGLNTAERLRAVAIAYKLSEMAHEQRVDKGEEQWLKWSVKTLRNDVLGMGLEPGVSETEVNLGNVMKSKELREELKKGLSLANWMPPMWRLTANVARPFEALGKLYAREGKFDEAIPYYLQAIDILMPEGDSAAQIAPAQEQCRAAQLMGNISETLLRSRGNDGAALAEAEAWARKGLEISTRNHRGGGQRLGECEISYAFMLYNLAMVRELSGDQKGALGLFVESLGQSKAIGLREGIMNAEKAIQDIGRTTATVSSLLPDDIP